LKWINNIGKNIPLHYHLYFWITYFSINVIRWGSYFGDYFYSFKSNLVEFSLHIILAYFTLYYLLPKYIISGKYKIFILFFSSLLVLVYFIRTGLNYLLVSHNIWPEALNNQKAYTINHFIAVTFGEIYVIALVSGIKLTTDWLIEKTRLEKLKKEKLKTELQLLKSQIRPHFFFNTLNNLYALTLEKSDMAPELVLKLSDVMEFVIYDSKKNQISLGEEIKYINNYIAIEKIRFKNRVSEHITYDKSLINTQIPPLLFLAFVENSFKHGLVNQEKINIVINFNKTEDNRLLFKISNNYILQEKNHNKKHGMGINNIKRRLTLLYQNNFELNINPSNNIFTVELIIPLQDLPYDTKN